MFGINLVLKSFQRKLSQRAKLHLSCWVKWSLPELLLQFLMKFNNFHRSIIKYQKGNILNMNYCIKALEME